MKRKRGRPSEKSFPEPSTLRRGFDIASFGKVGGSEAMAFVRDCPYATIEHIEKKASKKRSRAEKEFLRRAPEFTNNWALRIGPVVGRKILTGDGEFFRQIAAAAEKSCRDAYPIASFRRFVAMQYREDCLLSNTRTSSKGLRDYYRAHCPGETIDSSTLARMMKWVRSAQL
jgi:hypothetical protein